METGSYTFDGFTDSQAELARLMQQAKQIEPFEQSVLQSAGLSSGMTALDVGCGAGFVTALMAKMVGEDGEVLGVDASDDLLATAHAIGAASEVDNISFQKADIYQLMLPENSVDFVYSRLVFQHLQDPLAALQQLHRVLKPGGILCIADIDDAWLSIEPEPDAFKSLIQRAAGVQATQGGDRFIGHKLGSYLQKSGFDGVDVNVMSLNSQMMGMRNFLDVGISFRAFATLDGAADPQAQKELQALDCLVEIPEAWGFLGIFIASGKKPASSDQSGGLS